MDLQSAETGAAAWKAELALGFARAGAKTRLARREAEGPLVVQKPLYPEGPEVCHAIVVHPPGGIAGGDALRLEATCAADSHALLTTPGAGKWYRSAGPWASQRLAFAVEGTLEWLPRETIVFDGARAALESRVELGAEARFVGWEVVCLGRTGSGERLGKGEVRLATRITRDGRPLFVERGRIEGGGRLLASSAGLGGRPVFGTLFAAAPGVSRALVEQCRAGAGERIAITLLPGLLVARYLGEHTEEALKEFTALWALLRPALLGRSAVEPRIWRT